MLRNLNVGRVREKAKIDSVKTAGEDLKVR